MLKNIIEYSNLEIATYFHIPTPIKSITISIEEQASVLNAHGLLPRELRSFYHFIYYTFINIRRKNTSLFKQMLILFKKVGKNTCTWH